MDSSSRILDISSLSSLFRTSDNRVALMRGEFGLFAPYSSARHKGSGGSPTASSGQQDRAM